MSAVPEPPARPRSCSSRSLPGTPEPAGTPDTDPRDHRDQRDPRDHQDHDREQEETRILKVCFYSNSFNLGKNFKLVKCSVATEIREVIGSILQSGRMGPEVRLPACYGLRLKHVKSDEEHWLHPALTVGEVQDKYECLHLEAEWRYDLQIRYLPEDFLERFREDRPTLLYFYQQLRSEYMQSLASKVSEGMALQLGCLELRRFYKDMPHNALDKKSNFEFLEKEVGLDLFFPSQMQENLKPRQLRKMIQQTFQQYAQLREEECILKFLHTLATFTPIDQETFRCQLVQGWNITVDLVIGPKGIRQVTTKDAKVGIPGWGSGALLLPLNSTPTKFPVNSPFPALLPGGIPGYQIHPLLRSGGRSGSAAAGAQREPPGVGHQDVVAGRGGEHGRPHRRLLPPPGRRGDIAPRPPQERSREEAQPPADPGPESRGEALHPFPQPQRGFGNLCGNPGRILEAEIRSAELRDLPRRRGAGPDPGGRILRRGLPGDLHHAQRGAGGRGGEDLQGGLQPREPGEVPQRSRADEEVGPPPHRQTHRHRRGRAHLDRHGALPLRRAGPVPGAEPARPGRAHAGALRAAGGQGHGLPGGPQLRPQGHRGAERSGGVPGVRQTGRLRPLPLHRGRGVLQSLPQPPPHQVDVTGIHQLPALHRRQRRLDVRRVRVGDPELREAAVLLAGEPGRDRGPGEGGPAAQAGALPARPLRAAGALLGLRPRPETQIPGAGLQPQRHLPDGEGVGRGAGAERPKPPPQNPGAAGIPGAASQGWDGRGREASPEFPNSRIRGNSRFSPVLPQPSRPQFQAPSQNNLLAPKLQFQEEDFQRPGSREEAQELLWQERRRLEAALERQHKEMLEDQRWLHQEVQSLDPKIFLNSAVPPLLPEKETDYTQFTGPPQKPPRFGAQPPQAAPTARLDRTDDRIYGNVTELVRAVLELKDEIGLVPPEGYILVVKTIGLSLRKLIGSVDAVLPTLPCSAHTEIEGTQKLLNKDLANLIGKTRLAQQNSGTSLGAEFRRQMLTAAHALAVDAKNLLDAVDQAKLQARLAKPCSE
uniref:non-specific protein-tyrosine kinase n=1 Tax=Taeniopygia guttata TaxID=59729 RepID=A0A674HR63_TAEGU